MSQVAYVPLETNNIEVFQGFCYPQSHNLSTIYVF